MIRMQCPNGCSPPLEERKVEKLFHRRQEPIVVRGLTVYVCPECEHESLPLASARLVEDILNGKTTATGQFTAELYQAS
jgi:hypothetical protein